MGGGERQRISPIVLYRIVVYRVPATGTRAPRIAYRQLLWLAGMARHWAAGNGGLPAAGLEPAAKTGNSKWRRHL